MMLVIENLLTEPEVQAITIEAATLDFQDGRQSAGRFAAEVKANHQAAASPALDAIRAMVLDRLRRHAVFASAARPRAMTPPILSRYRSGQTYGPHVDDAIMGDIRTDLSYTLFLTAPDSYDGGELLIEDTLEQRAVKLAAGDLILYPSTTLHRVAPVTGGERLAIVGWVQSRVREADKREILFDLDRSLNVLHSADGKSEVFDLLSKTRSNLLRMWAD
jgi:PKHD-type hydroxylase